MHIEVDDLTRPQIHALLGEHLSHMYELSPPENVFALDLSKLRQPGITFFSVWDAGVLLGCGALKELSPSQGELKSMRTPKAQRRRGAGRLVLDHIIAVAHQRNYQLLSLETGSHPDFRPAQQLYASCGFVPCGSFGSYQEDPHSVFMQMQLR